MKARCHMTHTRPAVSAQRRGALGQVCSIPGSAFQSVSSDSCGCCQRAADSDTGTAPLHFDGNGAELRPRRACLQRHPTVMASHARQRHIGAPASRGIWKHLKLPRGRPGALRARPHTRLEHCSDPLRELAVPYGHSRPVGSLAGPLSKSTGLPNAKRIGTTTCTVLHLTGQVSNQDPPGSGVQTAWCQSKAFFLWPMPCHSQMEGRWVTACSRAFRLTAARPWHVLGVPQQRPYWPLVRAVLHYGQATLQAFHHHWPTVTRGERLLAG